MKDIMIDIETWGTKSNSAIVAIAAVVFDMNTGQYNNTVFYECIDGQSCINNGLNVDASTIWFWLNQSKEAINSLKRQEPKSIDVALLNLGLFLSQNPDCNLWGNSARFDLGLIENAFHKCGFDTPWKYWQERDVRTLTAFNPELKKSIINDLPHDPISDCLYQIRCCSAIWNSININK